MKFRVSDVATMSRRRFVAGAVAACAGATVARADQGSHKFRQLDDKIMQGMQQFSIPGAAVVVICGGQTYIRGYGVTDLSNPQPVDGNTVFRVASNSKTFTGLSAMRLVDSGALSLEAQVNSYIHGFEAPPGAGPVSVRQVLNHSAGWLGYDYHDTGTDDRALARYVHGVRDLPQLTPVGEVMSYNNAAISVAGRVIETITGTTFEASVRDLVFEPLGLARSGFTVQDVGTANFAAPHTVDANGVTVADPSLFYLPRSNNPFGGVLSCANDLAAYLRFYLGNGCAAGGQRLLSEASLDGMWSDPGPGGTLEVELDGFGVSWMVRPTAQGPKVIQHGGDLPGYHSGLFFVPDKQFAMTLLTNAESGRSLIPQLFAEDWALQLFAGLNNLPATPQQLSPDQLAAYEGTYTNQEIGFTGPIEEQTSQMAAAGGTLQFTIGTDAGTPANTLTFYKTDFVLAPKGYRANFLRDANGQVAWFRLGGQLYRRQG